MTAGLRQEVTRLLAAHRAGRALALLFDYDGTLVPIVEHPTLAQLPAETRTLLEQLARQPQVTVGILSGRRLEDLKEKVGLPGLCYCGVSGMELELRGERISNPQAARGRAVIAPLTVPLRALAATYPGAWVEDKGLGLTLHYRAVPPQRMEELRVRARQILHASAGELRILDVAMAIEITPAFGWTKGAAVRSMIAPVGHVSNVPLQMGHVFNVPPHVARDALPLYAGDEANDGDALESARALGGIAIGIGPRAPAVAAHWLPDPAGLLSLLRSFLEALRVPAARSAHSDGGVCPPVRGSPAAR